MSPSSGSAGSSPPQWRVRLPAQRDLRVTVYDAHHREISVASGATEVRLPRGLYSVRVEGPTGFEERAIRLDQDLDLSDLLPKRYSAAPIRGSQLAHEYYSGPSHRLSLNESRPPLSPDANAGLFIFARTIDRERAARSHPLLGLSLHLADGRPVTDFSAPGVQADRSAGWWSFSVAAPSGFYRLCTTGADAREIGIHLFPDWQTQVFLLVGDDGPVLEGSRIFVTRKGAGFQADDEVAELVDDSIAALADPTGDPPESLVQNLLDLKFENPVLGLIGAHLLIRSNRRTRDGSPNRRYEPSRVVDKLRSILGDCADVRALQLAVAPDQPSGHIAMFHEPPMLLAGLEAVISAARKNPALVADAPLVDDIVDNLYADSVWTTWSSLLAEPDISDPRSSWANVTHAKAPFEMSGRSESDWVRQGIVAAVEQRADRSERRLRSQAVSAQDGLSVDDLARQLDVTPNRIDRALRDLMQMSDDELDGAFGSRTNRPASVLRDALSMVSR